MLVLSRRLNQTIVIAGRVRVTVLAITPNRVELGVEAPLQIAVDREEVHLRRQIEGPLRAGFKAADCRPRVPDSPDT